MSSVLNSILAANYSEVGKAAPLPYRPPVQNQSQIIIASEKSEESALQDKQQDQKQQALLRRETDHRQQQTLRDLSRPQVSLLPADELDLFAETVTEQVSFLPSSQLSDETNRARRQVLVRGDREKLSELLQQRAQQSVANLYARNNNVVYNVTPLFYEAA